jgi:hypothetical protein
MFQLLTKSQEAGSATIPITWCVDEKLLERLTKEKIKNPHVLLVVKNITSGHESRHLVALEKGAEYIQFYGPGKNLVFAMLVWDSEKARKENLEARFLNTDRGRFQTSVLNKREKGYELNSTLDDTMVFNTIDDCAELTVNVFKELFATPRNDWHYKWVNFWFEKAPRDECDFRKRILFSYSLKPVLAFFYAFIKILSGFIFGSFLFGIGSKTVNWEAVFSPFDSKFDEIWDRVDMDYEDRRWGWNIWLWIFKPVFFLFIFGIVFFTGNVEGQNEAERFLSVGDAALITLFIMIGMWLVLLICSGIAEGVIWFTRRGDQKAKEQMKVIPNYDEELEFLLCTQTPKDGAITGKRKSFHLRFWDVKAKVCKPFAQ